MLKMKQFIHEEISGLHFDLIRQFEIQNVIFLIFLFGKNSLLSFIRKCLIKLCIIKKDNFVWFHFDNNWINSNIVSHPNMTLIIMFFIMIIKEITFIITD